MVSILNAIPAAHIVATAVQFGVSNVCILATKHQQACTILGLVVHEVSEISVNIIFQHSSPFLLESFSGVVPVDDLSKKTFWESISELTLQKLLLKGASSLACTKLSELIIPDSFHEYMAISMTAVAGALGSELPDIIEGYIFP